MGKDSKLAKETVKLLKESYISYFIGISDTCRCGRGLEFLMQVDRKRVRNF